MISFIRHILLFVTNRRNQRLINKQCSWKARSSGLTSSNSSIHFASQFINFADHIPGVYFWFGLTVLTKNFKCKCYQICIASEAVRTLHAYISERALRNFEHCKRNWSSNSKNSTIRMMQIIERNDKSVRFKFTFWT